MPSFDIAPDGRRFLMVKDVTSSESPAPSLIYIENWYRTLNQAAPAR